MGMENQNTETFSETLSAPAVLPGATMISLLLFHPER